MPRSEELRFRAGDATLAGTVLLPDAVGRAPWVVLVGSWLPRDRDGDWDRGRHPGWFAPAALDEPPGLLARLAASLADRGAASLRFDPRGCGDSAGTWEAADLFTRIDDVRDAIGAMRSRRDLDLRRCGVVGHGEGSLVAASVAISDPAIGVVGLIGPAARSMRDVLRRGVAERTRRGTDRDHAVVAALDRSAEELLERVDRREASMRLTIYGEEVELRLAGWEQAVHTPALALVTMLHRNVVIAHGSEDAWSDPEESRLLAAILREGGNDPVLREISGAGHDLVEADDQTIGAISEAVVGRLEPRDLPPVLVAIEEMQREG